ncbi:hypothetical protein [Blastomonas sp.]|uniref:hypothetical protein n=1 Tax=Blastomonas sp. TaxID=1909299 RepID=UPI00260900D2|nr:hypothetical protein [Blastomonas sp.]MDM7955091.1 hypothetical protein [Blastomonas sp.]
MTRHGITPRLRDHLAALLAALASAYAIGLADLAGYLPQGVAALDRPSGQIIGTAVCLLVYALVLTWACRRRLVAGPLYHCGESRPARDYGSRYEPGPDRLLEGWQYR